MSLLFVDCLNRLNNKVYCLQEELNRGKPNWEHLNEELHVLITVEDTRNRAEVKIRKAVEEVKKLLVPAVSDLYLYILLLYFAFTFWSDEFNIIFKFSGFHPNLFLKIWFSVQMS